MSQPQILVCNDDGIFSNGLRAVAKALERIGHVDIVAPNAQQSAVGHALTVAVPLRAERYEHNQKFFGWAVSGTPADCVKLATTQLLSYKPDLLVSGINYGKNTAISIVYSGTVSGATEGTMLGIPSIAISLDTFSPDADFEAAADVAVSMAQQVLQHGLPPGVLLNVNVPALPANQIKGIRVVPQGESHWNDNYDKRVDPMDRTYYWLEGEYVMVGADSDDHALKDGYVAVTPIHYRLTDHETMEKLSAWKLDSLNPFRSETLSHSDAHSQTHAGS